MKPELKRWLWDYYRRRAVGLGVICVLHFVGALFFLTGKCPTFLFLPVGVIFPLLIELQRKPVHVLMSLPLTVEDIWRGLWWISIGVPGIVGTSISFLALLGLLALGGLGQQWDVILLWILGTWGLLGLTWYSLSQLPGDARSAARGGVRVGIISAFWGVQNSFLLVFIPTGKPWSSVVLVLGILGVSIAVFGGDLTRGIVLERLGRTGAGDGGSVANVPHLQPASPYTGWWTLIHSGWKLLVASILVPAIALGVVPRFLGADAAGVVAKCVTLSTIASLGFPATAPWLQGVRVLRTLPLSAARLLTFGMCQSVLPGLVASLVFLAGTALRGEGFEPMFLGLVSMSLAVVATLPVVGMRFGIVGVIGAFFLVSSIMPISLIFARGSGLVLGWLFGSAFLAVGIAFIFGCQELRSSRRSFSGGGGLFSR